MKTCLSWVISIKTFSFLGAYPFHLSTFQRKFVSWYWNITHVNIGCVWWWLFVIRYSHFKLNKTSKQLKSVLFNQAVKWKNLICCAIDCKVNFKRATSAANNIFRRIFILWMWHQWNFDISIARVHRSQIDGTILARSKHWVNHEK